MVISVHIRIQLCVYIYTCIDICAYVYVCAEAFFYMCRISSGCWISTPHLLMRDSLAASRSFGLWPCQVSSGCDCLSSVERREPDFMKTVNGKKSCMTSYTKFD